MRRHAAAAALTMLGLALSAPAPAAPRGPTFQFSPVVGYSWMDDIAMADPGTRARVRDNLHFGVRMGRHGQRFGWELAAGMTPTESRDPGGLEIDFLHGSAALQFVMVPGERADWFALVGGGFARLSGDHGRTAGSFEQGVGARLWLSDEIALRAEVRNVLLVDRLDALGAARENHVIGSAGVTFAIGGTPRDTDADGVPDRHDRCPDTPAGARVDAEGCPHDGDGDRVLDGLDACEGTPAGAVVDAQGCPLDGDGDGVFDGLDACEETPPRARVDSRGCPADEDGDGVLDGIDECPRTPHGATVDSIGCAADSDGDGVFDGLDQCPNTDRGLRVDSTGCQIEITERETEFLDTGLIRLQGIQFETGRADILPGSTADLDVVAAILARWPQLRIEVGGHTDSRGSVRANQALSEARARSVVEWLTSRHPELEAGRFSARGYGESRPIATNATTAGRARNRRVEFVVLNRELLRREIERRRLVPRGDR